MNFNPDPTKQAVQVVFTRKSKQIDHPKIYFNDIEVKTVNDHKHLGLILDSNLSFISHINEKISKAHIGLGIIKSLSRFLSVKTLDLIFKLYIRLHLDFCDVILHIPSITNPFDSQSQELQNSTSQNALLSNQGHNKDLPPPSFLHPNRFRYSTDDGITNNEEEVGSNVPKPQIKQHPIPLRNISKKRPSNVSNMYPEDDNQIYARRTAGNCTYSDISKKGRKLYISADSIVKRMDMVNFSEYCKHKMSLKWAFPGCTASQLKHWIKPSLKKDTPDIAIIHVGANNLTKKTQSELDTVNEIIEVITKCRNGGVNEIYVSGLTCRYQDKINAINRLLSINADKYDYYYIDNSNIKQYQLSTISIINNINYQQYQLWKDNLHLKNNGIYRVAQNFTEQVNRIFIYNSTWV